MHSYQIFDRSLTARIRHLGDIPAAASEPILDCNGRDATLAKNAIHYLNLVFFFELPIIRQMNCWDLISMHYFVGSGG